MKFVVLGMIALFLASWVQSCKKNEGSSSKQDATQLSRVGSAGDAEPLVAWTSQPIDFSKQVPLLLLDYQPAGAQPEDLSGQSVIALCLDNLDPEFVLGQAQCAEGTREIKVKHVVQKCAMTDKVVRNTEFLECGVATAMRYEFNLKLGFSVVDR